MFYCRYPERSITKFGAHENHFLRRLSISGMIGEFTKMSFPAFAVHEAGLFGFSSNLKPIFRYIFAARALAFCTFVSNPTKFSSPKQDLTRFVNLIV